MTIRALIPALALKSSSLVGKLPFLYAIVMLSLSMRSASAQSQLFTDSAHGLVAVKLAEQQQLPAARLGYMWASLAIAYQGEADFANARQAYERALHAFAKDPAAKANYATTLDNLGYMYLEMGQPAEAETVRNKALAIRKEVGDPLGIAATEEHLAEVALSQRKFKDAERRSRAAFEHLSVAGVASGHPERSTEISALVGLIYAQALQSKNAEALATAEQAMQMAQTFFEPDSVERAHAALALGLAQWKSGGSDADRNMSDGIRILRVRLGEKSPILLAAMYQYRDYLKAMRREPEVASIERKIAERTPRSGTPCGGCAISVFALR